MQSEASDASAGAVGGAAGDDDDGVPFFYLSVRVCIETTLAVLQWALSVCLGWSFNEA